MIIWLLTLFTVFIPLYIVLLDGVFDQRFPSESAFFSGLILWFIALFISASALFSLLSAEGIPPKSKVATFVYAALAMLVLLSAVGTGMAASREMTPTDQEDRAESTPKIPGEPEDADQTELEFRFWNFFAITTLSLVGGSIAMSFAAQLLIEGIKRGKISNPRPESA